MKIYRVVFSQRADDDLNDLATFIAAQGRPRAAKAHTTRLREFCRGLDISPHRGSVRGDGKRRIGFEGSATVVLRIGDDDVEILGVAYRGRKLD